MSRISPANSQISHWLCAATTNRTTQLVDSYLKPGSAWSPTEAGVEPLADNFLINGRNTYDCGVVSTTYNLSAPTQGRPPPCTGGTLYNTTVRAGETVRLRLISHSSFMSFWFSVDDHDLTIVEMDGVAVTPLAARGVHVHIGQRYSVLLTANRAAGHYRMRATLPQTCFTPFCPYTSAGLVAAGYQAGATLSYEGADPAAPPLGAAGNVSNPYGVENNLARGDVWEGCDDMPFDLPVPVEARRAAEVAPENTHSVVFQFRQAGLINRIFINRVCRPIPPFTPSPSPPGEFVTVADGGFGTGRRPGVLTSTMRSCGSRWNRTSCRGRPGPTTTGVSGSTSRFFSSPRRARGHRLPSTAWM